MQIFFERRTELAPDIWQHDFRPEQPLTFLPGQYTDLRLSFDAPDPQGVGRTLTIATLPSDRLVSFVTKAREPLSPYKTALHALQPGEAAIVTEPIGDFILPKSVDTPLVFVAGGIGITSYVSMVRYILENHETRPVTLFYSLRNKSELIFDDIFDAKIPTQTFYAPERLTAQNILKHTTPGSLIYLSGSQQFVENLRNDLRTLGVENYRIIFEYYSGYVEL